MEAIDYTKLYKIQDKVLNIIFEEATEFYLTGGTCLSRFYYAKRYSTDLDFFANSSNRFHFIIRLFLERFSTNNIRYEIRVETKDFVRLMINEFLQIDFINDRVKYIGTIKSKNGYNIDNIFNILTNKITAVLSRDNIKDIFDIYLIAKNNPFKWAEVIKFAQEKMTFEIEEFCDRLVSFPKKLIYKLNLIDTNFLNDFDVEYNLLINDVIKGSVNSLCNDVITEKR